MLEFLALAATLTGALVLVAVTAVCVDSYRSGNLTPSQRKGKELYFRKRRIMQLEHDLSMCHVNDCPVCRDR